MQDRPPPTRRNLLATHGRTIHVGSDRRCQPGCGAVSAQYGRREEGDQRGPDTGELESQAGQAAAQRSRRWTVKFTKAKPHQDGSTPPVDLAIPLFGYQNHVSIDRRFGFIRRWAATDAATYEGRRLRQGLLDKSNTASGVWADTAYRSAANETFLNKNDRAGLKNLNRTISGVSA